MVRKFCYFMIIVLVFGSTAGAQEVTKSEAEEPDHIRGQIVEMEDDSIVVNGGDSGKVRLELPEHATILKLSRTDFTEVDFGVYVGSVSKRLDAYSPIVRDSLSWLHLGYELRIFDEQLRGLALGHQKWDLTSESVMTHGWVDDLEIRVLSIKYGPTEEEETDVDIPRDMEILYLSLGDKNLIKKGVHVFAGAHNNGADGSYEAVFIMVGEDGVVPRL